MEAMVPIRKTGVVYYVSRQPCIDDKLLFCSEMKM